MERADWLDEGFDPRQARFLMVTAITHHRFGSPLWGEDEIRKLQAELAEIDMVAQRVEEAHRIARRLDERSSSVPSWREAVGWIEEAA